MIKGWWRELADAIETGRVTLISRDEDVLVLKRYGQTEIIHVAEFLRRISS